MLMQPFVGYADFECTLKSGNEVEDVATGIVPPTEKRRKEEQYQSHEPVSYFTKFVSINPEFCLAEQKNFKFPQKETYVGDDVAEHSLDCMQQVANGIFEKYIKKAKPMIFIKDDEEKFEMASACHICRKNFVRMRSRCHNRFEVKTSCVICQEDSKTDIIVPDHCHILGHFRGTAGQNCNLNYRIERKRWKLPIFFHNLRGYDDHLLIRAVKKRHRNIRVIPNNMERYLAIGIGQVQFLDSFQFTMKSLDDLVATMSDGWFSIHKTNVPNT